MKRGRTYKRRRDLEEQLVRFGISIPADLLKKFDQHLTGRDARNRSEAIRDLIRDKMVQQSWNEGKGDHIATVTLVYDGQQSEFQRRLIDAKKAMAMNLLSSMQVRLAPNQDLEVLALKGPASVVRAHTETLLALKGLQHGKFVMTASAAS